MFWSKLIRYVALAGQVALAAGIAAIISMVLKYAIGLCLVGDRLPPGFGDLYPHHRECVSRRS
jgi:hypothetical protein